MAIANLSSMSFKTEFAVDMTCQSCVDDVKRVVAGIQGVEGCEVDLAKKQVVVTGKAPPSIVSRELKATGRQVLVRGAGTASGTHEGAAVAILETSYSSFKDDPTVTETQQVHGIARMVQMSTSPLLMLLDLTVRFPGYADAGKIASPIPTGNKQEYDVYVASTGDVSDPPRTTGKPKLPLARLSPDAESGYADAFLEVPVGLWDIIGRAMVVEPVLKEETKSRIQEEGLKGFRKGRLGVLAGVIARSAGAWGNEKTVCACSGQTMWQEGRLMEAKASI